MKSGRDAVVIVDGYSTGAFYVEPLEERGFSVVHADHALIRTLEEDAPDLLSELAPKLEGDRPPQQAAFVPQSRSQRTGAEDKAAAEAVWQALGLSPGMDVLDSPCGDGGLCAELARRGAVVTGLAPDPELVASACAREIPLHLENTL